MKLVFSRAPNHSSVIWHSPIFFCPFIIRATTYASRTYVSLSSEGHASSSTRQVHVATEKITKAKSLRALRVTAHLPLTCPGCGAFSHTQKQADAGFYTTTRKTVESFLNYSIAQSGSVGDPGAGIYGRVSAEASPSLLQLIETHGNTG